MGLLPEVTHTQGLWPSVYQPPRACGNSLWISGAKQAFDLRNGQQAIMSPQIIPKRN